jgi:hypothetical protein
MLGGIPPKYLARALEAVQASSKLLTQNVFDMVTCLAYSVANSVWWFDILEAVSASIVHRFDSGENIGPKIISGRQLSKSVAVVGVG